MKREVGASVTRDVTTDHDVTGVVVDFEVGVRRIETVNNSTEVAIVGVSRRDANDGRADVMITCHRHCAVDVTGKLKNRIVVVDINQVDADCDGCAERRRAAVGCYDDDIVEWLRFTVELFTASTRLTPTSKSTTTLVTS